MHVSTYVTCVRVAQRGQKTVGSPGTRVRDNLNHPTWVLGFRSHSRAVYANYWAVSPASKYIIFFLIAGFLHQCFMVLTGEMYFFD